VYYAIENPAKDVVGVVEAQNDVGALQEAQDEYAGNGTLNAREATATEAFRYLAGEIGLSHARLAEQLGVSQGYVGHRMRGNQDVRRLDVLALERLRELREKEE
jgi:hypothetical protein